jgi:hypothetical protein
MPRWIEPGSYPKAKRERDPKRQARTKRAWITKYLKAGRSRNYIKKLLGVPEAEIVLAYIRMKKGNRHGIHESHPQAAEPD